MQPSYEEADEYTKRITAYHIMEYDRVVKWHTGIDDFFESLTQIG